MRWTQIFFHRRHRPDKHQHIAIPVKIVRESPSVPSLATATVSVAHACLISVIIFLAAHLALLIGITTPEKFVFDEVHYVPAARQMLESAPREPMLNPMHPPLG